MPCDEREEIGRDLHRVFEEALVKRSGGDLPVNDKRDKTAVLSSYGMLLAKAQKTGS